MTARSRLALTLVVTLSCAPACASDPCFPSGAPGSGNPANHALDPPPWCTSQQRPKQSSDWDLLTDKEWAFVAFGGLLLLVSVGVGLGLAESGHGQADHSRKFRGAEDESLNGASRDCSYVCRGTIYCTAFDAHDCPHGDGCRLEASDCR
jgi:hypothetical protein